MGCPGGKINVAVPSVKKGLSNQEVVYSEKLDAKFTTSTDLSLSCAKQCHVKRGKLSLEKYAKRAPSSVHPSRNCMRTALEKLATRWDQTAPNSRSI